MHIHLYLEKNFFFRELKILIIYNYMVYGIKSISEKLFAQIDKKKANNYLMRCHIQLCSFKFEQKYPDIMLVRLYCTCQIYADFVIMKVNFYCCRMHVYTAEQLKFPICCLTRSVLARTLTFIRLTYYLASWFKR